MISELSGYRPSVSEEERALRDLHTGLSYEGLTVFGGIAAFWAPASVVGVVLVVLGVTGEGYWPLLWVGAAAIVVAVVGAVLLWRRRPSRR